MRNSNDCASSARRCKIATAALCSMLFLTGAGCTTTEINVIQDDGFRFLQAGEVFTSRVDGVYMDLETFERVAEAKITK